MKKRLIWLLSIFYTFTGLFAQQTDSSTRLKFMGKSMNCSISAMITHLKIKGCKIEYKNKNTIFMTGTFLGYLDCVFVLREDYDILHFCRIVLPSDDNISWAKLKFDYNEVIYSYTKKYGVPQIVKSEFEGNPYSDYAKLDFVEKGKCKYYSIFLIKGGRIIISIDSSKSVFITYEDSISTNKIEKINQDEL